jgi:hypothetical protein
LRRRHSPTPKKYADAGQAEEDAPASGNCPSRT